MWPGYQLVSFYEDGGPDDGLKYDSSSIVNCSLDITLSQFPNAPLLDWVTYAF